METLVKELDKLTENKFNFSNKLELLKNRKITKVYFYNYICDSAYILSKKDIEINKRITIYEKITLLCFKLNQLDN